jgi:DNA-binding Xre family transcriptional regulator
MLNSDTIVKALKQSLKARGLTYGDVAAHLKLTESSVKRLFSQRNFSLRRLDRICQLMETDLTEVISRAEQNRHLISSLNAEQEQLLVSDIKLLLIAVCIVNHWHFADIIATYSISEHEAVQALARLDRLRLIELQPGNRIKLLISPDFNWIKNGPIQAFFEKQVQTDFFQSRFNSKGEIRVFISGMLSRTANENMLKRIEKLALAFRQLADEDRSLPGEERFGTSMMLAMRPWELQAFEALRKAPDKRRF